jgi:hypothetical protein
MNNIERTYLVPQPFQVKAATSDRRRKNPDARAFDLETANADVETAARVETVPERTPSPGGDEGVGEHVNIVV